MLIFVKLSVILVSTLMISVIMLIVVIHSVIMLYVVILSVIMLIVLEPRYDLTNKNNTILTSVELENYKILHCTTNMQNH